MYRRSATTITEEVTHYSHILEESSEISDALYALGGSLDLISWVINCPDLISKKWSFRQFVSTIDNKIKECQQNKEKTNAQDVTTDFYRMLFNSKQKKMQEALDQERISECNENASGVADIRPQVKRLDSGYG